MVIHSKKISQSRLSKICLSSTIQFFLGYIATTIFPAYLIWGHVFWISLNAVQKNALIANSIAYVFIFLLIGRISRYPGERASFYILPTITVVFAVVISYLFFLRIFYSGMFIVIGFISANLWFFSLYFLTQNSRKLLLGLIPFGAAKEFDLSKHHEQPINFALIDTPNISSVARLDGIVADLHSDELSPEWERLIAHASLQRIPVYHVKQLKESLTGRVKVNHLSENEFGALLPSMLYESIKRVMDTLLILIISPLLCLVLLVTAICIWLDSHGGVIYTQYRIGLQGKKFKLYKFRSMYVDIQGGEYTMEGSDPRITKVGRFIRKYRIDELPQVWNVLKGEMSLIGPRPESLALAEQYESQVPFFSYRHVIRPGISGWAQVMQGYAAEFEEVSEKLEYDFYYIKHYSFWLDVIIMFKTVKIIFTGFGAR